MNEPQPVILDSSVALALVLQEPRAADIRLEIDRWTSEGRPLLAPSIFWVEVVNVMARKHGYIGKDVLRAIHELDKLAITIVETDRTHLLAAIDLVERFRLTAYDASYLALAQSYGAELATLDGQLASAAGARAIALDRRYRLSETRAPYEHDVTWPDYKGASAYLAKLRVEAREAAAS
jgi:predicted nucleic acid-binding protein